MAGSGHRNALDCEALEWQRPGYCARRLVGSPPCLSQLIEWLCPIGLLLRQAGLLQDLADEQGGDVSLVGVGNANLERALLHELVLPSDIGRPSNPRAANLRTYSRRGAALASSQATLVFNCIPSIVGMTSLS